MNRDEQALIEDNRQYDISRANESIRGQLSAGIAVEDVAKSLNTPDGMEPGLVLGAMSIAENYKINPGEAMAIAPSVFKQTHGDKYDLNDIIKDYYAKPADYELPFKHKTLAEFDAEIEQEETTGVKAYKQRKRQPNPLGGFFAFGGFNQALVREDIVRQQIDDKTWFQDNASKEKFVKSMITAETDEQKADLRRERLVDMISEQVDRAQSLRDMERKRKVLAEDSPGQWLSKYYAGARGVSRLRMSSYQAAGEALDILGSIAESGSLKSLSEDMNKMARGYWKAMQEPEVTPLAVNSFDRAVNSFLENVPHVGLTVLESVIVPPATPLFVFFNSTALEGTMIRQQALDAGFSEESSRVRGWIGGTVNGLIESIGGGAGKYTPKNLLSKIAKFPGKLTNNALKEIFMEEIPQEVVSMMLTNDVPHNADGTLDWDAITDRMISLAGDTAFASAMFTAGGSALGQYGEWSRGKKINKQFAHDMQIVMDNVRKAAEKATEAPATATAPVEATITPAKAKEVQVTPAKAEAAKRIISEEAYQKAKDYLTDTTRMSMGIDPEGFKHLVTAGAYWVETGIRDFAAWSKKMIDEYGPKIKPALHDIWQQVNPEKADDELTIKAPADDADITELVASAPSYGLQLQPDGKYAVMDWDTQQEVKSGLSEKYAANLAGQYNKGLIDPPKRRLRDNLPTSQDIETLTHGQLLNVVFKKVSQESRKAVRESVDSIITMHKDLISYARIALDKFDLTKGQQSKLLNKIALAATDKQKSDAVATIEAIREIARHSKAFSEFKKFRSLINRASNKKLSDGGIHWKVYEQLQELLNNYTTLSPKILNSIKRTDEYLNKLRENASENYSSDYAEALIPRTVITKLQELSSTRIQDMSAEQLESLNSSIGHLLKQSQLWDKLSTSRKVNQMRDFLGNAVDRIDLKEKPGQVKRLRKKKWLFGRAWDAFLGYRNDDIYTIFSRIYGKFDPLTIDTMRMRDNQTEIALKLNDMVTSVIDELGITTDQLSAWSPNMQLFDIGQAAKERLGTSATLYPVKIGDTAHQFFMSEIMVMYMHSKNAYNLNKIVKNGIGTYDLGIVGKLTQDEFTEMLSIIDQDPTARAFCDGLANLYIETARLGNEVSRELDGINLFNEDDYFHIEYVPEGGVIGTEYLRDAIVDEEGRLQPRTSSNRAVILRDIFEIVAVDINVMSNFIGMTEQLRKLRSLANYGPFRDKIRNAQKEDLLKAIDTRIGEVQRTRQPPSGTLDKAVQRLGRGAARASLTMPTVWLYQPMSAVLYTTETSDKYLLNMGWLSSGFEKELLQNWTLYRARKEGMSGSKSIASRGSIRKRFTGKNSPVDTQLAGLHKGDIWGVSRAALVTRAEMADTRMSGKSLEWWQAYGVEPTSLEYGSEQYWEAFKDRANYLVTLTQPMFFSENKGEYANSTNPIVREAARFRSFVDQTLRIMHRQAAFAAKGDQSAAASAKNIAITLLVLSVWKSLVKYEWDKHIMGKDKELDDLLRDILTSPAQLIPFLGYPASKIAQVALGADNLSVQSPSYSMVATMLVDNMLAHSYDMARGINYAMDDEYFQSGPNAGESKADVYLRRGIKGAFQDYLVLQGVPAYVIDQVQWYKD